MNTSEIETAKAELKNRIVEYLKERLLPVAPGGENIQVVYKKGRLDRVQVFRHTED